ncbi:ubiquitin-conjugating enzyme E2 U [Erinaceus europaeus]|uniref:Ubiquitin-conjugating enzyme E2 U n=1 Tax=Erinaceus europaeus TaxID=9365 RepID=A0ABM3YIP6_ERIEU|nr:ubiquitin-conjugating enzyme E2 U [Erinaceus europaeus]
MHSRAHILLKRDLQELKTNSYKGISAFPVTDNMMEWEASIEGLQNTICEGLSYQVTIHFTSEYNFVPPTVKFITIPFHPNVDTHSGQPCIDFLDNPKIWSTRYTLGSILLALQVMLSNPELENPVNLEAAKVLTSTEPTYRSINLRLCEQSLSLRKETSTGFQSSGKQSKFIKEVSFHNYYKTWIGIATSKSSTHEKTLLLKRPTFIKEYYKLKTLGQKHPENLNLKIWAAEKIFIKQSLKEYHYFLFSIKAHFEFRFGINETCLEYQVNFALT